MNSAGMAAGTGLTEDVLRMFRALGDDTRVRLMQRLRGGEQCVCDLPDWLEILRRALDELRPSDRALRVLRRCD